MSSIVADTGIVFALYDRGDRWHGPAVGLLEAGHQLVLPTPILAEVDHLLVRRLGRKARSLFYEGLAGDHHHLAGLPRSGYRRVEQLDAQFADLDSGLVDAAVLAVAESIGIPRIATADRRDFAPVAAALGLELLPSPPTTS